MTLYLVSYDIPEDKRRTKVAKALEGFGTRVQYSVFECWLDEEQLERMRKKVLPLLKKKEDNLRLYRICEACRKVQEVHGVPVAHPWGEGPPGEKPIIV